MGGHMHLADKKQIIHLKLFIKKKNQIKEML
jgi:hypothetical protein